MGARVIYAGCLGFICEGAFGVLLGSAPEQAQDDASGDPIIILLSAGAERGAVVVEIKEADVPVAGRVDIDPAADFIGKSAARGRRVAAGAADAGSRARTTDQAFDERSQTPTIAHTIEETWAEMISVENTLGVAYGLEAVTGVCDHLEPRFWIPAEGTHCAI